MLKFGFVGVEDSAPISAHDFAYVAGLVEYSVGLFSIVDGARNIFDTCIIKVFHQRWNDIIWNRHI